MIHCFNSPFLVGFIRIGEFMNLLKKLLVASFFIVGSSSLAKEIELKKESIVLSPASFIRFTEEVHEISASRFIKDFLSQQNQEIVIFIDSPGGNVLDGLRMIEAVRSAKTVRPDLKVKCVVNSAASMAFYFLQLACDERLVTETAVLMQHQAQIGVQGPVRQLDSKFNLIHAITDWLDKQSAKRLELTVQELREKISNDWWLIGANAVKEKVADKVVSVTCSAELMSAPPVEETKKAACPLVYSGQNNGGQGKQPPK